MMLNQSLSIVVCLKTDLENIQRPPSQLPQQLEWLNRPFYVWAKCDWSCESGFVNTQDLACSLPFFTGTQKGSLCHPFLPSQRRMVKRPFNFVLFWVSGELFRSRSSPTPGWGPAQGLPAPCSGFGVPEWGTNPVQQARTLSGRNPGHFFTVY